MTRIGLALLLVMGCTAAPPATDMDTGAGAPEELAGTLNVGVAGDSVRLELHVTNATDRALRLEFTSTQRYDFAVQDSTGEVVWSWSAAMLFGQMMGEETLLAGESRRYTETWAAEGRMGEYVATGRLTSTNYPVELRTRFRMPVE